MATVSYSWATKVGPFSMNVFTVGDQSDPAAATLANGNYIGVWSDPGADATQTYIGGRIVDAGGAAQTSDLTVNPR